MDDWDGAEREAAAWDDIALRVGWVAIDAARLENAAVWLFSVLLESRLAPTIALGQSWATVAQSCHALIDQHEARSRENSDDRWMLPNWQSIRAELANAENLMRDRANVVHGYWLTARVPGGLASTRLARRFKPPRRRDWSSKQLDQLSTDLEAATLRLHEAAAWFTKLDDPDPDPDDR